MDRYQKRYLDHQARKRDILINGENIVKNIYSDKEIELFVKILSSRKSVRTYRGKLTDNEIEYIINIAKLAPSSCNRHGVEIKKASEELKDLLVGGKGQCDKGTLLAYYADPKCYKSEYEKDFMPYLDTGFMAQNIYLACEALGIGCCFINPNTHNKYKSKKLLTGAMALGKI